MGRNTIPLDATENLPIEQVKAIEVLLTTGNKASAARAAGVDRSTLYRWMSADERFQAALEAATQKAMQEFSRSLVRLTDKAIKTLESAMQPKQDMRDRLRAANIVIARLLAVRELIDLEARLAKLEAAHEQQANKQAIESSRR